MPHAKRTSRLTYLWSALAQLDALAEAATTAGSYVAAVNAKSKAVSVRDTIAEIEETAKARKRKAPSTVEQHHAEVLTQVRSLRTAATTAGSYVAAATLLRLEGEMLGAVQARADQAAKDAREQRPVEDIQAEIDRLRRARGAGDPPPADPEA